MNANPAIHPSQDAYAYGGTMNRGNFMPQIPPTPQPYANFNPNIFPSSGPNTPQQQGQFAPQQFYQQFQQQQGVLGNPQGHPSNESNRGQQLNLTQAPYNQPLPATSGPGSVPQSTAPSSASNNPQQSAPIAAPAPPLAPNNMLQQRPQIQNGVLAQQAQLQNAAHAQRNVTGPTTPQSPQSAARERARVTVLLEINTQLLQEVVSLQLQGKAGVTPSQPQPSPTSPTSATDPSASLNQSPFDQSKQGPAKPPSQEYADCMRRLQANLSYLAAIADAKKKASGLIPSGPAIMIPPPHLTGLQDLYKKLNQLFPEASQSTVNKALAFANAQAKAQTPVQANG